MKNRQKEIFNYLKNHEVVTIEELADIFKVSTNTIRKDINILSTEGKINKFYGGVSIDWKQESAYDQRVSKNINEKHAIAKTAASLIKDGDQVFIDSGSTASLILDYVNTDYAITIITNNINVISKINKFPKSNLVLVGTTFERKTQSFVNVLSWDYYDSLNIDKSFLTTTGFSLKSGATNPYSEETEIKKKMVQNSKHSLLLIDSTKFDRVSLLTYAEATDFDIVISGGLLDSDYTDFFLNNNIQYLNSEEVL